MEREARSQAGCADTVTQGPIVQREGIPPGREEMSPSPTQGTSAGVTVPSVLCPRAHSLRSSPGPATQACLLVLQPGPAAPP